MPIEFRCIRCGQLMRVADQDQGLRARCPTCSAIVDIPASKSSGPTNLSPEKSDVIDYELFGDESQYVEITLDPGEIAIGRFEDMLYMSPGIATDSAILESSSSLLDKIAQVTRWMSNDSLSLTAFCNVDEQRESVAFATQRPSRLVPLHLNEYGHQLLCPADAILCVARGTEIRDTDVDGLPELPLHLIKGDGIAVLSSGGQLHHRVLKSGRSIVVRTTRIVAFTAEIQATPVTTSSPDGVTITSLQGPGEIWLKTNS